MNIEKIPIKDIQQNIGQVPGLPANPREWTHTDADLMAKSLRDTPELLQARPLLVVPYDGKYVILGGNLRYDGAKINGWKTLPAVILDNLTTAEMKEIVLADNGDFGDWDYIQLSRKWKDLPLEELGIVLFDEEKDFTDHNKEVDTSGFSENITLKLKFQPLAGQFIKNALGENKRATLLSALGYES